MSTILYVILAVVAALCATCITFVIIGKIEHKHRHININWLVMMTTIILGCSLVMVVIYHNQHDLTASDIQSAYDEGHADGYEEGMNTSRTPTNEEMETWFANTKEVLVGTNEGGDVAVHIIDEGGDEWVLYADEVIRK